MFLGVNSDTLLYDRSYGGVVTVKGMGDSQADYGSGWYSDHHFHYGYLIYAAGDWFSDKIHNNDRYRTHAKSII